MLTTTDPAVALTHFHTWWRRQAPATSHPATSVSALDALDADGPQRVSDLAARERISQPGMTALVTRMAADGLVERTPDRRDGRAVLVALTDHGRDRLRQAREHRADDLRDRMAALTPDERRALELAVPALAHLMSGATA